LQFGDLMKKFVILVEDDFEIMGNGQGNVADLQYLPAISLMNIANKYNWVCTLLNQPHDVVCGYGRAKTPCC